MSKRSLKNNRLDSESHTGQQALNLPESGSKLKKTKVLSKIIILPPSDVFETIKLIRINVTTTILDPWYNKGIGGVRPDYHHWLASVLEETGKLSKHIFIWGFPEIVAQVLGYIPRGFGLAAWLTWYFKNCPSVIRGWRSSQFACLHLAKPNAPLFPEHFLNNEQAERLLKGKLRFIPGPPTVLEAPLNVGFVGRSEQTGHPAQKPLRVIEPLILMTTKPGDIVFDPMCGSGTTGEACLNTGRGAILGDISEEYIKITEERLGIKRVNGEVIKAINIGS